ncbi:unnamed protein product [Oppiella nova]|uniref:Legumain n=1 Tax=Oppiella nova TaxID=334625 RepID=A0A7R9LXA3_9ACAR|nr:unnamed protein product [Oppiella nova]CAG2167183.1 unnamed protein product [Oppiella nova]
MHYDDIAYHPKNPTPGIIVNRVNGSDVYKGVPKHYTGADVTPENFLGVLRGDQELSKRGKKVIQSGPDDRIFVFLEDHGQKEFVLFPNSVLHAKDLNDVLINMSKDNKFESLMFYLDACYSELEGLLSRRKLMDKQIEEYVNELPAIDANIALNGKLELNHRECYRKLIDTFNDNCYTLGQNPYVLSKLQIFVNICEQMRDSSDADIAVNRLIQYCNKTVEKDDKMI